MYMNFNRTRNIFIDFFKSKNHTLIESSSLISNDNTLLFTNAGMNQFKDIFLGYKKIFYKNIITIQRCLRISGKHNDFNNIGYTNRHNTFFEMMGNFSFNSYFKEEAILYSWELLTEKKYFRIDKNKFIITVHINDTITYNIWKNVIGIPESNIFLIGNKDTNLIYEKSDNFWRMSDYGPCGYSTEIYYNLFDSNIDNFILDKNTDKYLEIWNLVFVEFNICSSSKVNSLPYKSVDTGIGLERISCILQNVKSIFDIDIFKELKNILSLFFNIKINSNNNFVFNIISDHIRSIIYLIIDGLTPSNDYRGYILRKIIRRVLTYIILIFKVKDLILYKLFYFLKNWFNKFYNLNNIENIFINIKKVIFNEEKKFFNNLYYSLKILKNYIFKLKHKNILDGKIIFLLYDTYGLSLNIIEEVCKYNNIILDINNFNNLLEKQKYKSRLLNNFKKKKKNLDILNINNYKTEFLGYYLNCCFSKILCILKDNIIIDSICNYDNDLIIILSSTVLYPESGGQKGDKGELIDFNNKLKFIISKTKIIYNCIIHVGKLKYGELRVNEFVKVKYHKYDRYYKSCNHSSCHILLYCLKNNISKDIKQYGSSIKKKYFTLDFNYEGNFDNYLIFKIIKCVNNIIWSNLFFKEKYIKNNNLKNKYSFFKNNNLLRFISFSNLINDYCCGTHVKNTIEIGIFIIKKIYNISSGIKRLKCCTNLYALKDINSKYFNLNKVCNLLSVDNKYLYNRVFSILKKEKKSYKTNINIYNFSIKNILYLFNKKDVIKYLNFNLLFKKENKIDFINNNILFVILNKLNFKYNLSLIIFLIKINSVNKLVLFINKYLLNNFCLNILDCINFLEMNKKISNNKFVIEIFRFYNFKKINIYKLIDFVKKKLLYFNKNNILKKEL